MVAGLTRCDAGLVRLGDADLGHLALYERARLGLGYLPQESTVFRGLSVRANLAVVFETMPLSAAERDAAIERVLAQYNLAHVAKTCGRDLSGGERRRLEMARALAREPKVLLLDEPFAGVDPIATAEIRGFVRAVCQAGIGVLLTDHNVRETLKICDRAYLISQDSLQRAMALDLRLQHKMSQQLVMTPQLQQAIKLLQLSHLEIADVLREEIEQNPVLEEQGPHEGADELEHEPGGGEHQDFDSAPSYEGEAQLHAEPDGLTSLVDSAMGDAADLDYQAGMLDTDLPQSAEAPLDATPIPDAAQTSCDVDWENYIDAHSYALPGSGHSASDAATGAFEAALTKPTSLAEHLRWQVRMSQFTPQEQAIAFLLIEEVNADGYLNDGATLLIEDELDCSATDVEHVLHMLQDFDPKGVGARNLAECLSLQARHLAAEHPVVHAIIEQFLPLVERRDFGAIARRLKVSPAAVSQAVATIKHLEPRPGAAFYESEPQYITPDIYVHKVGPLPSDYVVMLNEEGLPRLRISEYYRDALGKQLSRCAGQTDTKRGQAVHPREIPQRRLAYPQHPHAPAHHLPDVDMHESTISRVTANKYVHTPQGIYELKYFFNSSIRGTDGDSVASESVRNHIERLIASEDSKAPLSDQRIVQILKVQDIDIARRTVAKYREMLKIPSSSRRRRVM
ncbi:hypothetical protein Q3G72_003288 [Acer saccharum]|nr:hypothetical protein Q3G72_003288 [Acer saccharum]